MKTSLTFNFSNEKVINRKIGRMVKYMEENEKITTECLQNINVEKIVGYWVETSDDDFKTMANLFKTKDYHWVLFIGHLVLEKLLKACVVKQTSKNSPFTHDLT